MAERVFADATFVLRADSWETAEAISVVDGRIARIGQPGSVLEAAGRDAEVVELGGATVLPGFIDAHCHLAAMAYVDDAVDCSPSQVRNVPSLVEALAGAPPRADGWITGVGYQDDRLAERRHPTRRELDAAIPTTPAVVYHTSYHGCVVNSAALALLGLNDDAPDPPRGRFGRAPDGTLDGRLYEEPMTALIGANMETYFRAAGDRAIETIFRALSLRLAADGVTACVDANLTLSELAALRRAEQSGSLGPSVRGMIAGGDPASAIATISSHVSPSGRLTLGGVKLFADGGMSSRTAALWEPYVGSVDRGVLVRTERDLAELLATYDAASTQVAVHAQGDRAIAAVLAAVRALDAAGNPRRHRIEHGGVFTPSLRAEAGRLGMSVVSQPGFIYQLGDGIMDAIGSERSRSFYPYRSLREAGVTVAGSSDAPIAAPSPMTAVRDAVVRRTADGRLMAPDESISVEEAIDMYTRRAAFASFQEAEAGTIAPGLRADFVVLDRDPRVVDPNLLSPSMIAATFIGGEAAYSRSRA